MKTGPAPAPARQKGNRPVALLIVEDSKDDVGLVLRALQRGGFEPTYRCVQSMAELQASLAEERWDAVLSDFSMPGFTGLEALAILRATGLDIPFILISGTVGEATAVEAMKAGASDYVMKQSLARLAPALERELRETQTRAAHRLAQTELIESEERFRGLTALSSDWYWEQDAQFRFVKFSGQGRRAGWASDQLGAVGLRRWEIPGLTPLSGSWEEHKAQLEAHKPFRDFGYHLIHEDGSLQYMSASGEPVFDAGGRFTGYRGVATDITERKRTDHELQRFRAAMDIAGDAIVLVDRSSMRYIDVNQTTCDMSGLTRQVLLGMTPMDLTGQSREVLEREYDELIAGNNSSATTVERQVRRDDGSDMIVEIRRRALRTESGWVIVGTTRDISERKRGEEALLRFIAAIDATSDAIYLVDRASMGLVHVNEAACRMQGKTREELLARGPANELASREELERIYDTLIASGVPAEPVELQRTRVDGVQAWLEFRRHALPSAQGWTIVTIVRDITERKRSEASLSRFRTAMEVSGDGILLIDRASMRYIDVNQKLCDMVGRTRQELLGMTAMEVFSADRATLERDYDALIADNTSSASRAAGHCKRKDGSVIPVESRRQALLTDDGWVIVGTVRDVTESREAERKMARDEDALRRFGAAMDAVADAIYLIDRESMRYVYVNDAAFRRTNLINETAGRPQSASHEAMLLGQDPWQVSSSSREELERVYNEVIAGGVVTRPLEQQRRNKDGAVVWDEFRRHAVLLGGRWMIVVLIRDVTERKAADDKIRRLNRVFAVLSGINTLIVRVTDRDELFREACRVAVDQGGFKMAWIGIANRESMMIDPIASAGAEPEFLAHVRDRFSLREDSPLGSSMAARSIRDRKPVVCNDISTAPDVLMARKRMERGIASMAILPLLVADEPLGVLCLYAAEKDFFDAEEMKLLTDLAGDIAFAIDHIAKQERLEYLAYYDVLTGLPNRSLFLERVTQYARSAAAGGHGFALFFIDLERFKNINESLGRPAGDALLRQVADLLKAGEGDPNLVARVGADHFAVVMPEVKDETDVVRFLDDRIERFQEHLFSMNEAVFRIAMKVGVSMFPKDGADAETLLRNAEAALKKAKSRGERYVFYKQKMTDKRAGKLSLENKLRSALENEEFVLHYQPKVSLQTGRLTGAEALIRWNDPLTGLVPPGQFIPILEETGLIHDVGRWALRKALEDYLRWRAAGLPAVRIAVNVSPLQLRDRGFIAEVAQAVGIDASAPEGLELEITESLIMADVKHSIASLQAVRDMKVTVAIDDFGTGFSSLAYLARLPVDSLKIDRSFVVDMTTGPQGMALVSTIIKLAHSLQLGVVAEGVETEEQSSLLRLLGCDEMQGYLYSRPVPGEVFEAKFLAPAAAGKKT